jgi:nicotinamidase-related amidase
MMHMQRDHSQLLIIDVQEKLLPTMREPDRVVAVCKRLMTAAKRLGVPITVSEQYPQGIGATVEPLLREAGESAPVLKKVHFSCMRDDGLRERLQTLRSSGRNQVILAGIESHICVTQTALDLIAGGFCVFVAGDGVSSRTEYSRDLALARLRAAGAIVADSEMVIFEWLDRAATPEFKDLLPLFK